MWSLTRRRAVVRVEPYDLLGPREYVWQHVAPSRLSTERLARERLRDQVE